MNRRPSAWWVALGAVLVFGGIASDTEPVTVAGMVVLAVASARLARWLYRYRGARRP